MTTQFVNAEVKGIAKDAHEKFPIRFDYSEAGNAFFNGCRVEATIDISNGRTITKRMDIRAFGEIAEALAHVQDGTPVHVKGSLDQNKGKDDKYYPVLTVTEIVEA